MKTPLQLFTATLITTAITLGITGCQTVTTPAVPVVTTPEQAVTLPLTNERLEQYVWQLMTVTDKSGTPSQTALFYNPAKPLLAKFGKDGQLRLTNTCNNMWADYMLTNDNVVVGDFAATRMMCEPAHMAFDAAASSAFKGQFKLTQISTGQPVLTVISNNQISVFKPVAK